MNDPTAVADAPTAVAPPPTKVKRPRATKAVKKATPKKAIKKVAKKSGQYAHNVVDPMYRKQYTSRKGQKTASGGTRIDCDDDVAKALLQSSDETLGKLANRLGLGDRWAAWSNVNVGMRRMNFGNVVRGMVRRGELVLAKGEFRKGEGKPKVAKAKVAKAK